MEPATIVNTRAAMFSVDGTAFDDQTTQAEVQSAAPSSDFLTMEKARNGARDYTLQITCGQDVASATALWGIMFTRTNEELVCYLKPYGEDASAAPTPTQPWVKVTATVTEPDGTLIGGQTNSSVTARQTVQMSWTCTRPEILTAPDV